MKILVTGAGGMLGTSVVRTLVKEHQLILSSLRENLETDFPYFSWDIQKPLQEKEITQDIGLDAVIHCAAYTKVDLCESERELATAINIDGTHHALQVAKDHGAFFIYISSDYIFDGTKKTPYKEEDLPSPVSVYGETKLGGERVALGYPKSILLRSSWLYGGGPSFQNFVNTMIQLAENKTDPIRVVDDQRGSPTSTEMIAAVIQTLLPFLRSNAISQATTFHLTNQGECSWFEFAKEIFRILRKDIQVVPTTSKEFARPAERPAYSVLSTEKIRSFLGVALPTWQASLEEYLQTFY